VRSRSGPCALTGRTYFPIDTRIGVDTVESMNKSDTAPQKTTTSSGATTGRDTTELRVVVGVDGSAGAERALIFAAREASLRGALLHIVGVCNIPPSADWIVAPIAPYEEFATENVRHLLGVVRERFPDLVTKGECRRGPAGVELVEAAQGATLLVVGTRGHSEVTELLIGSVSEYCAHHAPCPVTIVR
jgi:nucleotide-binding universal stress UspA family protein